MLKFNTFVEKTNVSNGSSRGEYYITANKLSFPQNHIFFY